MSNVVSLRASTEVSNVARPQHEADPVTYLIDNMERVAPSNISFVSSLIAQALGRKGLSDKQMYWVRKFASELANPPAPAAPVVKLESLKAINDLFRKAGDHLKYPKVRLQITKDETTHPVVLSIAGPNSKYFGQIMLTDGGSFGNNTFYGRVTMDGEYIAAKGATDDLKPSLVALLTAFAKEPAKVASDYGRVTGSCCFCSRALTDKRSTDVGYGPICADRYALPWGE